MQGGYIFMPDALRYILQIFTDPLATKACNEHYSWFK